MRLRDLAARYDRLSRELDAIRCRCASTTPKYQAMPPSGSGGGDRKDGLLVLLGDKSAELDRLYEEIMEEAERTGDEVAKLREAGMSDRDMHLLVFRFIERQSLARCRRSMSEVGYPCSKSTLCLWIRRLEGMLNDDFR